MARSISTPEDPIISQSNDRFPQVFPMGPDADSSRQRDLKEILRKTVLPLTATAYPVEANPADMRSTPSSTAAQ